MNAKLPEPAAGGPGGRNVPDEKGRKGGRHKWSAGGVAALVVGVMALGGAVYIMAHGLGLNPDLDFGAGAYYYADIPDYQKVLNWDVFSAKLPFWVYLVLFLAWGWLMWRLWKRIEK